MSDVIKGFIVILAQDQREDNCESIKNALSMVKGVCGVESLKATPDDYINRQRIRIEFRNKLFSLFRED